MSGPARSPEGRQGGHLHGYDPFAATSASHAPDDLSSTARTYPQSSMPIDTYRVGGNFVAHLDLPGVDPGSIDLSVEGTTLTVTAWRSLHESDYAEWEIGERSYGGYTRQLVLDRSLDTDQLEASYHDGVLTIRIPITVNRGDSAGIDEPNGGVDDDQTANAAEEDPITANAAEEDPITADAAEENPMTAEQAETNTQATPGGDATPSAPADRPQADAVERAQRAAARALIAVKDRLGEPVDDKTFELAGVDKRAHHPRRPGPLSRLARAVLGG